MQGAGHRPSCLLHGSKRSCEGRKNFPLCLSLSHRWEEPGVGLCQDRERAVLMKQMTARYFAPLKAHSTLTHLSSFAYAKPYSRAHCPEFTLSFFLQSQSHFCTSACLQDLTHTNPCSHGSWIPSLLLQQLFVLESQSPQCPSPPDTAVRCPICSSHWVKLFPLFLSVFLSRA